MGLDGGTYITRSDVLRGQSWTLAQQDKSRSTRGGNASTTTRYQPEADQQSNRETRWSSCTLSGQPLREPVVADHLGALYNREAVLEFLLMRNGILADDDSEHRYANVLRQAETALSHLRCKRDIFTVHVTPSNSSAVSRNGETTSVASYECPVQHVRCDRQPFSALSTCGHVFSDKAVKQFSDGCCPVCSSAFKPDNVIPINGSPEVVASLRTQLAVRKRVQKSSTKKRRCIAEGTHAKPLLQIKQAKF